MQSISPIEEAWDDPLLTVQPCRPRSPWLDPPSSFLRPLRYLMQKNALRTSWIDTIRLAVANKYGWFWGKNATPQGWLSARSLQFRRIIRVRAKYTSRTRLGGHMTRGEQINFLCFQTLSSCSVSSESRARLVHFACSVVSHQRQLSKQSSFWVSYLRYCLQNNRPALSSLAVSFQELGIPCFLLLS